MKTLKRWLILIPILLILSIGATIGLRYVFNLDLSKSVDVKDNHTKMVTIPEGSSTQDIADILVNEGIISDAFKFRLFSRLNDFDGKFLAGQYPLAPTMTTSEIAEMLCLGLTEQESFTIPEGYTINQIADTLYDQGLIDKEKFLDLTVNGDYSEYSFLEGAVEGEHHLEGYLFPETYTIPVGADEDMIIRMMLDQFNTVFSKYEERAKEMNMTVNEAITLASLVEKEAILDTDRALVSSVIHNRIKVGMPLQIDATIHYALELIGMNRQYLTYDDLEVDSPYNTYKIEALPPGPIASPGEACIKAALYPAETDYIYYVLVDDSDAAMAFSTNYEDFMTDVEHWASTIPEGAEEADQAAWEAAQQAKEEEGEGDEG